MNILKLKNKTLIIKGLNLLKTQEWNFNTRVKSSICIDELVYNELENFMSFLVDNKNEEFIINFWISELFELSKLKLQIEIKSNFKNGKFQYHYLHNFNDLSTIELKEYVLNSINGDV